MTMWKDFYILSGANDPPGSMISGQNRWYNIIDNMKFYSSKVRTEYVFKQQKGGKWTLQVLGREIINRLLISIDKIMIFMSFK